ncbi:MAG: AmmeMemoRadiSam system protein A [Actinomycetota bacterium]|nr:AmmeMemoRadiSam system protein A [Actinomycetota bacterium]
MPVVIGAIVPHPPLLLPEIGKGNLRHVRNTEKAMKELAKDVADAKPDTLLFVSPHSPIIHNAFAIKTDKVLKGSFADFGYPDISFKVNNDTSLATSIIARAKGLGIGLYSLEDAGYSHLGLLDHGVMVPLHFLAGSEDLPIVSLSISDGDLDSHFDLGKVIADVCHDPDKRIAFIASGDLSHRLIPGAPASFDPRGKEFDLKVRDLVASGDIEGLLSLDDDLIEAAGECGLRSFAVLAGVFSGLLFKSHFLSYEGPFGVGYLVASLTPLESEGPLDKAGRRSNPKDLAKRAVETYIKEGWIIGAELADGDSLMTKQAGVFVCIKQEGGLRGCMGTFLATKRNVAEEIIENAILAATGDPRFLSVKETDLYGLEYSVDILTEPLPVKDINELDPKIFGIVIVSGKRRGLLLPDLEGVDTVEKQILIAKSKGNISEDDQFELLSFTVERYPR